MHRAARRRRGGVPEKALRSLGVGGAGKTAREREFRAKTKARVMREMIPYPEVKSKPGVFPGFGPHAGFEDEDQLRSRFLAIILSP